MTEQERALAEIEQLGALQDGWRGNGSFKPSFLAIENARKVVLYMPRLANAQFAAFPTGEGGVIIECEEGDWNIAIEAMRAGGFEFYGVEVNGVAEVQPTPIDSVETLLSLPLLSKFHN